MLLRENELTILFYARTLVLLRARLRGWRDARPHPRFPQVFHFKTYILVSAGSSCRCMAREKPKRLPGSPLFLCTFSASRLKAESRPHPKRNASSHSPQVILSSMRYHALQHSSELLRGESCSKKVKHGASEWLAARLNVVHSACRSPSHWFLLTHTHTHTHTIPPHLQSLLTTCYKEDILSATWFVSSPVLQWGLRQQWKQLWGLKLASKYNTVIKAVIKPPWKQE